mgnify:CR=1 FL=1
MKRQRTKEEEREHRKRVERRGLVGLIAGGLLFAAGFGIIIKTFNTPYSDRPEVKLYHQAEQTLNVIEAQRKVILRLAETVPYQPEEIREDIGVAYGGKNPKEKLEAIDNVIKVINRDLDNMRQNPVVRADRDYNNFWGASVLATLGLGALMIVPSMYYSTKYD